MPKPQTKIIKNYYILAPANDVWIEFIPPWNSIPFDEYENIEYLHSERQAEYMSEIFGAAIKIVTTFEVIQFTEKEEPNV